jgi:hypothetical protein
MPTGAPRLTALPISLYLCIAFAPYSAAIATFSNGRFATQTRLRPVCLASQSARSASRRMASMLGELAAASSIPVLIVRVSLAAVTALYGWTGITGFAQAFPSEEHTDQNDCGAWDLVRGKINFHKSPMVAVRKTIPQRAQDTSKPLNKISAFSRACFIKPRARY